ncbi:MAG: NAD(P)H-dependent flavin oxidoreductase [Sphingomonas sp.]|uniref:NAD(P)H-dependent flavin oxidoreductase n=1 Tax=Sphingomonas sp. TaxID=28214 RepID=UPI003F40DCA1
MTWRQRSRHFCNRFGLALPILLAPMAGASSPRLSAAVANAGGLGACGALLMKPEEIRQWADTVRSQSCNQFMLNLWVPDPAPQRDAKQEAAVRRFLERFGPPVPASAGDATPPDFDAQCRALLDTGAPILSSVMGLFPSSFVQELKRAGAAWFAVVSTLAEARAAEAAGADVIVAQGSEAGGHRAAFDPADAERKMIGLFSLLPALVDAVSVPVVATGGIADARGVAAALTLGASAVQIGTGFLRCPEAEIHPLWADAISHASPDDTVVSRVFSGRPGRSIVTNYVREALRPDAPEPAPYPVQRGLTAGMRSAGTSDGNLGQMQAWAGQSAALASAEPAGELTRRLWAEAQELLP